MPNALKLAFNSQTTLGRASFIDPVLLYWISESYSAEIGSSESPEEVCDNSLASSDESGSSVESSTSSSPSSTTTSFEVEGSDASASSSSSTAESQSLDSDDDDDSEQLASELFEKIAIIFTARKNGNKSNWVDSKNYNSLSEILSCNSKI